jgi:orotate phosphoribosyltransferase
MSQRHINHPTVIRLLQEVVALMDGHFVLKSRRHSGKYFNKDAAFPRKGILEAICERMAATVADLEFDFVVSPATAGVAYSYGILQYLPDHVQRAYADKDGDGFVVRRGFEKLLQGMHVVVAEDVGTTGGSTRGVIEAVRAAGGTVIAVVLLCNRGGLTAEMLGVPRLENLLVMDIPTWSAEECPLCAEGVPINTEVGHGAEFLREQTELGVNPT